MYLDYLGKEVHLIDGVTTMLNSLKGARIAVLTNGFKDVQLARIAASGLADTFEAIFTSEEIGLPKATTRNFRACIQAAANQR